ncbi:hemin receptor [Oleiphilus sp. HI0071]|uniref:globin family protein n=3 Tax=unclassified Oleiphilus TaxID=2631174 RepID=UPI0007C3CA40|nr:globin family protein [Oleiphilus sp. HI0079]KZY62658.1 hemin receptor [Oleiphilus sp. HI0065]KZY89189.1 hemin receptor [Oleiphilus sp. HI0073]KZY90353.1 hemin receptor [Oleiphilus sp. HI0071]KZZ42416.1 hemin receptor [Oleiphilus sp. HI0118]KZZ58894.1 hemin receptor [Oleiphilus sp. HI0122]KZZ68257.1 hemin receptor [Oleiphilus sp. HI0130]KZZ78061.1 hemin receptor [Oleiphilus sp. HI0133]
MAITEAQKKLVQASFAKVEPIADAAAEIFYNKLFTYDPSLKPLFKHDMKGQGKKLMTALKLAVKSLDDLDALVPVLENMAVKHVSYGVKVDDYTPVGNALINTLAEGLGDDFTPDCKAAWVEVYKTIAIVMRSKAYPDFDPNTYQNTKQYVH